MSLKGTAPLSRWSVGSDISSLAVSHGGTRVFLCLLDGYVCVWDLHTESLVVELSGEHTSLVSAVAWSHDDNRIVSGFWDNTIITWDAHIGTPLGMPLKEHTGPVMAVAFSLDDTHILSGSADGTIRIWDVDASNSIGEPFRGHADLVLSVAFSPNNTRVISGSRDHTILIWDVHAGAPIVEPLRGHSNSVCSVNYSSDSTRIVSGSWDTTIRIWDARTGDLISEPLQGHTDTVYSVAFSSDSNLIVSGSCDLTIRIWDAHTGAPLGVPLWGHTDVVLSVGFLSNSTRVISGSSDGTVCLWEARQGTPAFDMVTSNMSVQEMFECLVKHGCTDLTSSINTHQGSSSIVASGGFGDVRCLKLGDDTSVALKTLRLNVLLKDDDKAVKRAVREVYIWSRLHHPNIQKLLGVVVFQGALGMVSPWMEQGNLQQYLVANHNIERRPLCIQLASGVLYLHGIGMVHGDIKATNVLVSDNGMLRVNDFDYAILSQDTLRFTTTTRFGGGTLRWMAPELFEAEGEQADDESRVRRSKETDVYALGMTMLEIFTSEVPFAEYRTDAGVCGAILKKQIPRRPSQLARNDEQAEQIWKILVECWSYNSAARPNVATVLHWLNSGGDVAHVDSQVGFSTPGTSASTFTRLRRLYRSVVR